MGSHDVPPQYPNAAYQQQADDEATRRAQEFQRQQEEAADAAREAAEIRERERQEADRAAADQANRTGWSSQQR